MSTYRGEERRWLTCEDFTPKFEGGWEPLGSVIARADEWAHQNGIEILQLESLLLPCLWGRESSEPVFPSPQLKGAGEADRWVQVLRIWYRRPRPSGQ